MPTSRIRKEIMYSFTRSLIGEKLARMEIQDSVVVSTTSATDSPSAPTLYWIPKSGIQSDGLDELEGPRGGRDDVAPRQEAEDQPEARDPGRQGEEQAVPRIAPRLRRGIRATTTAPTSGRKMIRLRIGKEEMSTGVPPTATR